MSRTLRNAIRQADGRTASPDASSRGVGLNANTIKEGEPGLRRDDVSPAQRVARTIWIPRARSLVLPLVLLAATFLVLLQYDPFHRPLLGDPGIFVFISRLVAQGLAPHRAVFNEQASLTFLLGGAAMAFGNALGVPELIAFRVLAMGVAAGVIVITYVVGRFFTGAPAAAFIASVIMLGYEGYLQRAATALEPKALMVLLGLLTLYGLSRKRWFVAGICAAAAGLAWQIGWGYLLVALLLAPIQGGTRLIPRLSALGMTILGAGLVFALYVTYYAAHDALAPMFQQTLLAPLIMHPIDQRPLAERFWQPVRDFLLGYRGQWLFLGLGAISWLAMLVRYVLTPRRALYDVFQNPRTSGTLLAAHGFMIAPLLDFQNYPDWIPLLPFISIFAGGLLIGAGQWLARPLKLSPLGQRIAFAALLSVVALWSLLHPWTELSRQLIDPPITWQEQSEIAQNLNRRLPPDQPVLIIGAAELLFFMARQNVTPYVYLLGETDAAVDALDSGGFEGMLEDIRIKRPALIVLTRLKPDHFANVAHLAALRQLSRREYVRLRACSWLSEMTMFLRADLAESAFPSTNSSSCFSRAE